MSNIPRIRLNVGQVAVHGWDSDGVQRMMAAFEREFKRLAVKWIETSPRQMSSIEMPKIQVRLPPGLPAVELGVRAARQVFNAVVGAGGDAGPAGRQGRGER